MRLALAQMKMEADMEKNYNKSIQLIRKASENGVELVCFPEIQLTTFFPQYKKLEKSIYAILPESSYIKGICELCRELEIYAVPNFYIQEDTGFYDMSLLIDDNGEIIGRQKMVHIAQCENFYEQDYYKPSEEGFKVFDTKFGKIGVVVCFDRHYPESIRTEALIGAELIIIPTANITAEPSELFQWEVKIQAFQNSVNIAMCNRVGKEDKMTFSGESIVADYNGDTVALAGSSEELLIAEVDLKAATKTRKNKPYTGLRRKEFYE